MTDQEMLRKCLEAFRSMATADDANRFLHQRKVNPGIWHGTGQHKLRKHMIDEIEKHLGLGQYPA